MDEVTVEPLTPNRAADFFDFFDRRAFVDNPEWSGCYCYFPYHDPATGSWDERSAAANRAAMAEAIQRGAAHGFLAYADGQVVGWCNAAPRQAYPTLARLPGDPTASGATPCFVVDPQWRRKGVAARLLYAACEALRAQGMRRMDGAPARNARSAARNFRGPLSMFVAAGYEVVDELPDGTVIVAKSLVP